MAGTEIHLSIPARSRRPARLRDAASRGLRLALAALLFASSGVQAQAPDAQPQGAPQNAQEQWVDPEMKEQLTKMLAMVKEPSPNAPKPSPDPRNLAGIYIGSKLQPQSGDVPFMLLESTRTADYKEPYAAMAMERLEMKKGKVTVEAPSFNCRPFFNIGYVSLPLFPTRVVQTKDRIVFLIEEGRGVWEIFMNSAHPKNLQPSYNGHSVGHWEGDTLVVDVAGFNGKQWLDQLAGPNTANATVKVWIKKTDGGKKLDIKYQVNDPALYRSPPALRHFTVDWNPELRFQEFNCEESIDIGSFPGSVTK